jgi:hypothetical protein
LIEALPKEDDVVARRRSMKRIAPLALPSILAMAIVERSIVAGNVGAVVDMISWFLRVMEHLLVLFLV